MPPWQKLTARSKRLRRSWRHDGNARSSTLLSVSGQRIRYKTCSYRQRKGLRMSIHILRLEYVGRSAVQGIASDLEKQVINGASLFLGGHAAYLTEGLVPDHIMERTRHYALHDVRRRRGPFSLEARISFQTDPLTRGGGYLARLVAQSPTKKAFKALVLDSFDAWQKKQPLRAGFGDRVEPILVDAWPEKQQSKTAGCMRSSTKPYAKSRLRSEASRHRLISASTAYVWAALSVGSIATHRFRRSWRRFKESTKSALRPEDSSSIPLIPSRPEQPAFTALSCTHGAKTRLCARPQCSKNSTLMASRTWPRAARQPGGSPIPPRPR